MSKLYVVFTNTDLTEGRGYQIPIAWSVNKYTAQRMARGEGVMGSNADVRVVDTLLVEGKQYLALDYVLLEHPTKEDKLKEQQEEERNTILTKMKELGVTEEMLNGLGVK
jgi:hypothetical protein